MWGGHTGPGGKTIIPKAAHAKVSFRLVADQDPADVGEAFREYVRARTPAGLAADGDRAARASGRATRRSTRRPCSAGRRAMQRAFGREVLFTKEGGSGPEADLAEILGAPLVFVAVGLDSDRIHAPNETVDMSLLLRGARGVGVPVGRAGRRGPRVTAEPLGALAALARGTVDRVTEKRGDTGLARRGLAGSAHPRARGLRRAGAGAAGRRARRAGLRPRRRRPPGIRMLLGQDGDGVVYFGVNGELPPGRGRDAGGLAARGGIAARGPGRGVVHARGGAGQLARHAHALPAGRDADGARSRRAFDPVPDRTAASTSRGPIRRSSCW